MDFYPIYPSMICVIDPVINGYTLMVALSALEAGSQSD
jgi:hypothetical protein